jgi:hypothetical protein
MRKRLLLTITAELTNGSDNALFNSADFDTLKGAHVNAVWVRFGGKSVNKKQVTTSAVGEVLTLVLSENGKKRVEVPLALVEKLSTNGFSQGLALGYVLTLSESKILVQDPSLPVTGTVVELVFDCEKE